MAEVAPAERGLSAMKSLHLRLEPRPPPHEKGSEPAHSALVRQCHLASFEALWWHCLSLRCETEAWQLAWRLQPQPEPRLPGRPRSADFRRALQRHRLQEDPSKLLLCHHKSRRRAAELACAARDQ